MGTMDELKMDAIKLVALIILLGIVFLILTVIRTVTG
jgi:hypothetical protein